MQQEVGFDPCQMTHSDLLECVPASDLIGVTIFSGIFGLLMAPAILRHALADPALLARLTVPQRWQRAHLVTLCILVLLAGLWTAAVKIESSPFHGAGREFTPPGELALRLLVLVSYLVAPVFLSGLLVQTLDRTLKHSLAALLLAGLIVGVLASVLVARSVGLVSLCVCFTIGVALAQVNREARNATWATLRFLALPIGTLMALRMLFSNNW